MFKYRTSVSTAWSAPYLFNVRVISSLWNTFVASKALPATPVAATKQPVEEQKFTCPYDYILDVYGKGHFAKLINILDPELQHRDPALYALILDIMDVVHFGAILVDDVADQSTLRKGKTAAHHIFGSAETVNRTYLRIFETIGRCQKERPSLIPFLLENLTEIHKGQDISLVWRRDGFEKHASRESALDAYRECASLKTGALFRLAAQLVRGDHEMDEKMSDFGWFCHLQNDCKNVFSSDVVGAKGALGEDLVNGDYSFPILVGLHGPEPVRSAVSSAMSKSKGKGYSQNLHKAVMYLQEPAVRGSCLTELESVRTRNPQLATLWGRKEAMSVKG